MYADYEFYAEQFYGAVISEADFPRLSFMASEFIDYYTKGKAETVTDENTLLAIKKACCAVAEQMQVDDQNKAIAAKAAQLAISDDGGGEVKSETVGSWSRSYATASDYVKTGQAAVAVIDESTAYARIAQRYLTNTGLLYRGGCKK